jgi:hypothetical protein
LLAAFCHLRTRELIDTLSDLLIDMVHRVAHRAEVKVERELVADFKRVSGKNSLLFQIAEASPTASRLALSRTDRSPEDLESTIFSESDSCGDVAKFVANRCHTP